MASGELRVRAGDGFCLRTPLLPMTLFAEWTAAADPRQFLATLVELPEVREALFVASPSLSEAIETWKQAPQSAAGRRAEPAIAKYVARMMGRSTPFGLFSGVSAGRLGRETKLAVAPRSEYRRRTRLDNDYLFLLIDGLVRQPEVRARLVYRPSTSIYRSAGRLRYAGARLVGAERSYHLISVEPTPYLEATLERAANGARYQELVTPLVDGEITVDDARGYIDELIDAHVLVPELGVHVTGPEPIDGVIDQLRDAGIDQHSAARATLEDVRSRIAAIDAGGVGNAPALYREIAAVLEPLPAKVDLSRLFQVDMVKPAAATLGTRIAADIAAAFGKLSKVVQFRSSFDDWKRAFRDRWEDRMVPLAEVLDEESGIGFESARGPGAEGAPLLAGLPFGGTAPENRVKWSPFEQFLLKRLAEALASGSDEIVLEDTDLESIKLPTAPTLPDAFSVMCRLEGTADAIARSEPTIFMEGLGGPSGARILGRFCHASPEIDEMVRAHHAAEHALRPDAVFAEIVHLNEGRIGNILCRPVLRDYEIVYLGVSGAPIANQISVADLLVGLRGDRIVLWSQKLDREVLPRLTTAHNFRLRSLAMYRFLCALANHGIDNVGWNWGPLASAPFLPRVRMGRIVWSRATWNLDAKDLEPITAAVRAAAKLKPGTPSDGVAKAVAALRSARKLPRMFMIAMADNELPIDLDNPLLAEAFADEVSGSRQVELTEMFPAPDRLVVSGAEGAYANELVVMFTRQPAKDTKDTAAPPQRVKRPDASAIRNELPPGSEWLYAKIYCGESTGDRVLREVIGPVARAAIASGDASQWFFIRYQDPDPHLRVRFRGEPARLLANVLPALERAYASLAQSGAVRKLVLDTYVRETDRYGGPHAIELVEELFWRDSEAVLEIVELLEGDAGAVARWKLAVRGIDSQLESLGLTAEQRAKLASDAREMLGREYRAESFFWTKVGEKFTRERADLEVMFDRDPARDAAHDYEPGFASLAKRDAAVRPIAAKLRELEAEHKLVANIADFAWSVTHMHANRLLHASQRAQELVLYDLVRRLYAARQARGRKPAEPA